MVTILCCFLCSEPDAVIRARMAAIWAAPVRDPIVQPSLSPTRHDKMPLPATAPELPKSLQNDPANPWQWNPESRTWRRYAAPVDFQQPLPRRTPVRSLRSSGC